MPGIYGLIVFSKCINDDVHAEYTAMLAAMKGAMMYEKYYESKQYINTHLGVYIGWVGEERTEGLQHICESPESGRILFSAGAFDFDSGALGDYKEILKNDVKMGEQWPRKIGGLNAGCLIDERNNSVFLFNDRYGMERIFLYEDAEKIIFSSEAKAILAVMKAVRKFDPKGIAQYLTCGCTLEESSLYSNIRIMPGGSIMQFSKGKSPIFKKYFDVSEWESSKPMAEVTFLEQYSTALIETIENYEKTGSRKGLSLTGGLDSRMIMACFRERERSLSCYTFGSMYRETFDVSIARAVAAHCQHPHKVLTLGNSFLDNFKNYLSQAIYVSDGYLGFSGAAEYYLNKLARSLAPLRITGNYGGELLRGIRAFKCSLPKTDIFKPDFLLCMEKAVDMFSRMCKMQPESFTLFVQVPSGYGRYSIERSQVDVLSPFIGYKLAKLIYSKPVKDGISKNLSSFIIGACNKELLKLPTDRGELGNEDWLRRTVRHITREAIIKAEYWTSHGMPDWLSHTSRFHLTDMLERMFLGRNKFQHFRLWSQTRFDDFIKNVLLQNNTGLNDFIYQSKLEKVVDDHLKGKQNNLDIIDKLMTLTIAHKTFIEEKSYC